MLGQGIEPEGYHPIVDMMSEAELKGFLKNILSSVQDSVARMPAHEDYILQYCKA